jgi:hypothetical protein
VDREEGAIDEFGMPMYAEKQNRGRTTRLKNLKTRKQALIRSLIHVPSVAITFGVLSLTFRHVFWEPPSSNTNAVLNSLQFAAQLHGSLIVMSLSAMLMHLVHHGLGGKHGVPLGFISSSFQLNSLSYLFRKEFTSLNFRYITIFLCAFVLTMLSGPSSAIAMIPRLQFWSIDNLWLNKGNMDFRVYIQANETSLYPATLTAENAPLQCFDSNSSIISECPSYGMRQWMMDDDLFFVMPEMGSEPSINRTIQESWIRYMVGQSSFVNQGIHSVYSASTLSNFLGRALFAYDELLSSFTQSVLDVNGPNTIQTEDDNLLARYDLSLRAAGRAVTTRKPLVEVECAGYPADSTSLTLVHDRMFWPPWTSDPFASAEWIVASSEYSGLSVDLNSTLINSSWIDIEQFGSVKPSLAAIFATPETISTLGYPTRNQNFSLYTCTIDARWMPTRAFSDASSGHRAIFDSNPNPEGAIITSILGVGPTPDALPNMFIADSWAKLLNVPWTDSVAFPVPTNRTILDTIAQKCLDKNTFFNSSFIGVPFEDGLSHRIATNPMAMTQCLQVSLSIYLADAIARVQDSIPTYFVAKGHVKPYSSSSPSDVYFAQSLYDEIDQWAGTYSHGPNISQADFADPNKFLEIYMPASRWGYGYGFQDSKLIFVGSAVLLLHAALCFSYVGWTLGLGEYRSGGWDTIGELLLMAMRSGTALEGDYHETRHLNERKNLKRKWTEKFGVRNLGTPEKGESMVLRRVGQYEGRESDIEGDGRRSRVESTT